MAISKLKHTYKHNQQSTLSVPSLFTYLPYIHLRRTRWIFHNVPGDALCEGICPSFCSPWERCSASRPTKNGITTNVCWLASLRLASGASRTRFFQGMLHPIRRVAFDNCYVSKRKSKGSNVCPCTDVIEIYIFDYISIIENLVQSWMLGKSQLNIYFTCMRICMKNTVHFDN